MHGLYVLWWVREKHVSPLAVAAILAAGDLAVTVLEIPTGWLADRRGHRLSLIAGSLLQIAGMLFAWLGSGIPGILASSLIIAAGDAFRSGADQALLYRSCAASGEPAFQAIEARTRGLQLAALVALVLAGGAIVDRWGFHAGWAVETAISIAGLAIACAMVEPFDSSSMPLAQGDAEPVEASNDERRDRGLVDQLKALLPLIMPAAVLGAAASAATFYIQADDTADPARMTIFVAVVTLAEAVGAAAGAYVAATARAQVVIAASGLAVAAAALVVPAAFLPASVALCVLMGLSYPVRAAAIQHAADDHLRARAASLASACDKLLATAGLLCAGVVRRRE